MSFLGRLFKRGETTDSAASNPDTERPFDSALAMVRLSYLGAGGCLVILIYSLSARSVAMALSVGLMTACAASMSGVLVGFIFGVPFTRDAPPPAAKPDNKEAPGSGAQSQSTAAQPSYYKANTSLEQISDWLAKMLVGVGLVEIKAIPPHLQSLARYIALGLGGEGAAETLSLAILIYFPVCGFLFGFLWARIYLRRWFVEADEDPLKNIDEKLTRIEADAKAIARVTQQLNRGPDDELIGGRELADLMKKTSTPTREQIFNQASSASGNFSDPNHQTRLPGVISILKSLIDAGTNDVSHRHYSELSLALSRQKIPDLKAAMEAINKAMSLRGQARVSGWKSYELRRARYRMQMDDDFNAHRPSSPEVTEEILRDLRIARADEKWERWLTEQPIVREWIGLNQPLL